MLVELFGTSPPPHMDNAMALLHANAVQFEVSAGRIRARVADQSIHAVHLDIDPLPAATEQTLKAHPLWMGHLLDGRFPEALLAALLPPSHASITPHCVCADGMQWCRHAVATLAAVLQTGGHAVLQWRGIDIQQYIEQLWPTTPVTAERFWTGAPLPMPEMSMRPPLESMPKLSVGKTDVRDVLEHATRQIQRMANTHMTPSKT